MIDLAECVKLWPSERFKEALREAIEQLDKASLPLQQNLALSSHVADEPVRVVLHGIDETPETLNVRVGIFYSGIIAGCSCADDPTPDETQNEYCELLFVIDKQNGETLVNTIED